MQADLQPKKAAKNQPKILKKAAGVAIRGDHPTETSYLGKSPSQYRYLVVPAIVCEITEMVFLFNELPTPSELKDHLLELQHALGSDPFFVPA
ncbi:hypothetical protein [Leisingera sp. ANG59]|uniref:hypothetical protein n=1 Tax=Leisingera sp. ANG59 TaxID=2675221 RepID=UPI001572E65D|nr:hypothetical protein [Leisingera sp. ANG59]NSY40403.1 hypothetical protein [Leisingera sp. ANG59]